MRKWHRWLSVVFGVFLLWIAGTGVLSQIVPIVQQGGFGNESDARSNAASVPFGFICPETMICRPKPQGGRSLVGTLHHLHSGESFGPAGTIVATLTGLALIFFAISGLWMYIQMWRNQAKRSLKPKWFWK